MRIIIIEYQNKKHSFNWLSTLHVTSTIPRYRLGCWYRPVQKLCLYWCYRSIHCFGPVYISINRNFKAPSMILIKSTLKMLICLYVRFYLFLTLQFLLRFLDSLKNLYVCVFNSINTIVTVIEDNIRIYRLPSGRGMDHKIDISLASGSGNIIFTGPSHDPWAVCIFWYFPPYQ